jgi:cell division septal protein FtsQ
VAYRDEDGKGERIRKFLSALIFPTWILIMALAGFYTPTLLMKLPFLQVRELVIEGNRTLKKEEIEKTVKSLEGNLMKLKSEDLLTALNDRSEGRVRRVFLKKDFGLKGVSLRVLIEERIPVAKMRVGNYTVVVDGEGFTFPPRGREEKGLPLIITRDPDRVVTNFGSFYRNVLSHINGVKRIYIGEDRTVLRLKNKTLILPALELIPDNISERIKMIYNLPQERVDLRYDRFILVRN